MPTETASPGGRRPVLPHLSQVLLREAAAALWRHKSFFLLVLVLLALDHGLDRLRDPGILPAAAAPDLSRLADLVFVHGPPQVVALLTRRATIMALVGLFLVKQLISLWPSSDMRRMHRRERGAFGLAGALTALRWDQLVWDLLAVGGLCLVFGLWAALVWTLAAAGWTRAPSDLWTLAVLAGVLPALPLVFAGFSYSSKLAVLSRGRFGQKMGLFLRLIRSPAVMWRSWLFFLARLVIEALFVALVPAVLLLIVPTLPLRLLAAALVAIPCYAYLKMASFKFFLRIYADSELVQEEYREYFFGGKTGKKNDETPR